MSLHLDFEPHSFYMDFAIKDNGKITFNNPGNARGYRWEAYIDNGNTYRVDDVEADTLGALYAQIIAYHLNHHNGHGERLAKRRLEHLRTELRAERISYRELAELQSLVSYIDKGDVELLEAAGAPE